MVLHLPIKQSYFNAIVNERYLEFNHEGIRKYDLIRWNLLAKLAETRTKVSKLETGLHLIVMFHNVYYKNIGEEIVYYTAADSSGSRRPFWRPTQVPPTGTTGTTQVPAAKWVRIDWAQHLTANVIDGRPLWQGLAYYFVPGKE
ncbi:MAG: RagB/SusD family nutrient uptake outer membrane protein [Chitinophagaceae bacterium]|nr:RagB/SusD family nutrient uptake outer membrane protein [Chitinophagaceae bacterium]